VLYSCLIRALNPFPLAQGHILLVVLKHGRSAPSQKADIKDDQPRGLVRSAHSLSMQRKSVVAGDADRDLERRLFMVAARHSAAHQALACGTSAAGVPRTYRIVPAKRRVVHEFLARSASGCGGLLNAVMVLVGDKLGLYKTGQYSSDADRPSR
jgi:hypothetical protein